MNVKLHKIVIRMSRLAIYSLVICQSILMALASESNAQRKYLEEIFVNLDLKESTVSLRNLIRSVESSSSFKFAYSKGDLRDKEIKIESGSWNLRALMNEISTQGKFSIRRINETITLMNVDHEELPEVLENSIVQITVKGIISDENGEPLPGATILEKGTTNGTTTDIEGNYSLSCASDAVLTISFVGYKNVEQAVNNRSAIDISLSPDAEQLQEVIVVGYGTVEKRDITGSVASFDEKALDRQAANNITELMRSALPGLNVGLSTNAEGNSGISVRGQTSLGATNSPLIVVDDVIFQGDLSSINPADVESVNVLKDASAAAVYGSRAAAGVIIITTKKGKSGKPNINIKSTIGLAHAGVIQDIYGPEGYLEYRRDVQERFNPVNPDGYYYDPNNLPDGITLNDWLDFDGLSGTSADPVDIWLGRLELTDPEIENYKAGRTVDYKDLVFQTGLRTNNTVSLSGASDNISYYSSLGFVENEGISRYEKYQAVRGRINLEADINDFISVGTNIQASSQTQPTSLPNTIQKYENTSPYGSLYYDDGTVKHLPHDDALNSNILLYEYRDDYYKQREVFSNIYGKIKLPLGFSYRVNWTNRLIDLQDYRFRPVIATLGSGGDTGSRREFTNHRWMVDNIFNWNRTIGDIHSFDFTFLYNVEEGQTWNSVQSNSQFSPNDALGYHNLSIGANPELSGGDERYTADAMMGSLNYGLLDRYYLTLTLRRDGYSAFGQSNPRAYFPAVSLAWRLSDEAFLDGSDLIDNLKLRLSWGQNGNREIGIYSALSSLEPITYIYDQSTVFGVSASALANQNLKWETTSSYNIGLDFGILGSRIYGSMDAYYAVTTDQLLKRSLPIITGFNSIFANLGEVQNRGFELALNTVNMDQGKFRWESAFSFWMNRNKIVHLYGDMVDVLDENDNVIGQREEDDIQNDWYIGHAIDEIFDYKIIGIWQLGEEDDAALFGKEPGDVKLEDINGDGILNNDDKVFQGNRLPQYRLSLRNDLTYGNFDFSILINSFLDYYGSNSEHFNFRVGQERINKRVTPYWTEDNPTNEWTRIYSANSSPATNWWENKSFVRIQNITLGYNFPNNLIQRVDIQKLRLYANVQNLPALSGWAYNWDVETSAPTPLIYTLGIDLTF